MSNDFTCATCGEAFTEFNSRKGRSGSPVSHVEEFHCPNGHRGVMNYGPWGHVSQTAGIRFPDQHELAQ